MINEQVGVCHLLLDYYPRIGGTEVQARRLASYQHGQGLQVCVVASRHLADPVERAWPAYEEVDGISIYRVPIWGKGRLAALSYLISGLWRLFRLRKRYQVIHAHMISAPAIAGGLAGQLLGKKVVAKVSRGGTGRVHISDSLSDPGALSQLEGSFMDRVKRFWLKVAVDRYLAISGSVADELGQRGFPRDKIVLIPNGIDVHRFAPSDETSAMTRARLDLPPVPLLTYIGILRPRKNLAVLIRALPLLLESYPSLCLVLVGAGIEICLEEERRLKALANELGLQNHVFFVECTGDVVPYLQVSSVFAILSYTEGLSNAMLEAMSVGLPIVATPVSGAEDLIQTGINGLLLSVDPTPEEVARAVLSLLDDPDRAHEMGRCARQTVVERCAFEVVGERILSLYRELLVA